MKVQYDDNISYFENESVMERSLAAMRDSRRKLNNLQDIS